MIGTMGAEAGLHAHHHGTGAVLRWSLYATLAFVAIQVVAGVQARSLALLSDAGHNFTDALALLLAAFAFVWQTRPADEVRTWGYHRAGVLSAFVNAISLIALSGWIFWESVERWRHPQAVREGVMIVVAGLGLLLNAAIMWGLREAREHDLNVRGAFLHMLGDALGSVAIIVGAVAIRYTGWQRIDAVLSVLIGILIVYTAWEIVRESLNILLEGLPRGLTLESIVRALREVDGVLDVHDLHVWSLGPHAHALSCHALIADLPPSASDEILRRINRMLAGRFHIHHTTVQFEHAACAMPAGGCSMPAGHGHHHRH